MTADPLAEVLAKTLAMKFHDPFDGTWPGHGTIAKSCIMCEVATTHQADAVRAFLSEHFAKPEVVEAVALQIRTHRRFPTDTARAALAALLTTLGGES